MDDAASDNALFGKAMHFGHQVVAQRFLQRVRTLDVDVLHVRAQIVDLLRAHETGALLRIRQRDPDAAPQPALVRLGPDATHRLAAIAPTEGAEISLVREGHQVNVRSRW